MYRADSADLQLGAVASATGNVVSCWTRYVSGTIDVRLSGAGTILFQGSTHGVWSPILATNMDTAVSADSTSASGLFRVPVAGLTGMRCHLSTISSGMATVTGIFTNHHGN